MSEENKIYFDKHILVYHNGKNMNDENNMNDFNSDQIDYLLKNFCGRIITDIFILNEINNDTLTYLMGNIMEILEKIQNYHNKKIYVIKELSYNYENYLNQINIVAIGKVPLNIHNVGIFYRNFFDNDKNYFKLLNEEHQFQLLTESNKPGKSYRKGIYLSNVVKNDDGLKFNLLRCSTNLDGPTENFRNIDKAIIEEVQSNTDHFFHEKTNLNHVLAQVYSNTIIDGKEKKAKISAHSDKTKDMMKNGLIIFCTFYQFNEKLANIIKNPKEDSYDYYYKNASILTRLRFHLKKCVNESNLIKTFDVILYPNSVFIIPLSTNRLYTHEIVPSYLPIDKLPIRLGYVIRCSDTEAIFKDNNTYIIDNDANQELFQLIESTEEQVIKLKNSYLHENISSEIINYDKTNFSLNNGDYLKPII